MPLLSLSTLWLLVAAAVFVACAAISWRVSRRVYKRAREEVVSYREPWQCRPSEKTLRDCTMRVLLLRALFQQFDCPDPVKHIVHKLVAHWRVELSFEAMRRALKHRFHGIDDDSEDWLALRDAAVREVYWVYTSRCFFTRKRLDRLAEHGHVRAGWLAFASYGRQPTESLCQRTIELLDASLCWDFDLLEAAVDLILWQYEQDPTTTPEETLRWLTIWPMRSKYSIGHIASGRGIYDVFERLEERRTDDALRTQRMMWIKQEMALQERARLEQSQRHTVLHDVDDQ